MLNEISIFLILLFFSVLFISQALLLPAAGKKAKHSELIKRLKENQSDLDNESKSLLKEHYLKGMTPFEKQLIAIPFFDRLKKLIDLSGVNVSLPKALLIVFFSASFVAGAAFLVEMVWFLCLSAFISVIIAFYTFINYKISKKLQLFEEQLPEALDIIKRVLQSGQPINQAMGEVGKEMPYPIGPEFMNTYNLLNFGYDIRLAILQMTERIPTVSMMAFSSAVMLQKETGGNLTENLDKVSKVLRARFKLTRKIKTVSAEARMSAWILVLAPFVMFLIMMVMNRSYTEHIYMDPRGLKMIAAGAVSTAFGAFWIRKIINIEV
ncbi:type II secretion system F family protein [Vibrio breoganii]